jgi:hypothetical protein
MTLQLASSSLRCAAWVLLAGALCLVPALGWAQRVAFINPGDSDEAVWVSAPRALEAAVRDLGVELEERYAERQFPLALELTREIAAWDEAQRPEYGKVVNEGAPGPELPRSLADRTQVFLATTLHQQAQDLDFDQALMTLQQLKESLS